MSAVVFFAAALGATAGAVGVVAVRNPFFSVLALVFHLLSLAALFLLLRAEFVAAAAPLFAIALFVELCLATLGSGLKAVDTEGAPYTAGFGSPGQIGELFLTRFLLPFEVASLLLLIAAVGAVILARRRRGLDEEEDRLHSITVADLFGLPEGLGTQAETVGTIHDRHEREEREEQEGW